MPMSQDSLEIKTIEQWKWSEMQGLELVVSPPTPPPPSLDPSSSPLPFNTTPTLTINTTDQQQQLEQLKQQGEGERKRREMDNSEAKKDGTSSGGSSGNGEKPGDVAAVGFGELFRFADGLDYVLMGIGSIGALVHGCSLPIFLRFFADLVNSFGSNANNIDKMMQEVLKVISDEFVRNQPFFVFPCCKFL